MMEKIGYTGIKQQSKTNGRSDLGIQPLLKIRWRLAHDYVEALHIEVNGSKDSRTAALLGRT
jgi:hypothetical protein